MSSRVSLRILLEAGSDEDDEEEEGAAAGMSTVIPVGVIATVEPTVTL